MKKSLKMLAALCFAVLAANSAGGFAPISPEEYVPEAAAEAAVGKASANNLQEGDFQLEGCTYNLVSDGYGGNNAVEIVPYMQETKLYLTLPALEEKAEHEKVHVTFRLFTKGTVNTYDDFTLSTWGDRLIDYGYPAERGAS